MTTLRLKSPAAARNRQPILEVLRQVVPPKARILEVAGGSGEHAVYFAAAMPGWEWHPTDCQAEAVASIEAWRAHAGPANLHPAAWLDVAADWPAGPFDGVVAINLVHISPWETTLALLSGAGQRLRQGGVLVLYGPYRRGGRHTAPSNEAFDASLRARDPRWGVRDLEAVVAEAQPRGFSLQRVVAMPANNMSLVLRLEGWPDQ